MRFFKEQLFPFLRCPVCGGGGGIEKAFLCDNCLTLLKKSGGDEGARYCVMCGKLLETSHSICGDCLIRPKVWDYFYFYGYYTGLLKELITEFKYSGLFDALPILQNILCEAFLKGNFEFQPDIIVPVPIHKNRLKKRGFNQSVEIAKKLSATINISIERNVLIRKKDTLPQVGLTISQRRKNVKNAFTVKEDVRSLNILLIDDVFTSGSTISECAVSLKNKGAKNIGVVVLARAIS